MNELIYEFKTVIKRYVFLGNINNDELMQYKNELAHSKSNVIMSLVKVIDEVKEDNTKIMKLYNLVNALDITLDNNLIISLDDIKKEEYVEKSLVVEVKDILPENLFLFYLYRNMNSVYNINSVTFNMKTRLNLSAASSVKWLLEQNEKYIDVVFKKLVLKYDSPRFNINLKTDDHASLLLSLANHNLKLARQVVDKYKLTEANASIKACSYYILSKSSNDKTTAFKALDLAIKDKKWIDNPKSFASLLAVANEVQKDSHLKYLSKIKAFSLRNTNLIERLEIIKFLIFLDVDDKRFIIKTLNLSLRMNSKVFLAVEEKKEFKKMVIGLRNDIVLSLFEKSSNPCLIKWVIKHNTSKFLEIYGYYSFFIMWRKKFPTLVYSINIYEYFLRIPYKKKYKKFILKLIKIPNMPIYDLLNILYFNIEANWLTEKEVNNLINKILKTNRPIPKSKLLRLLSDNNNPNPTTSKILFERIIIGTPFNESDLPSKDYFLNCRKLYFNLAPVKEYLDVRSKTDEDGFATLPTNISKNIIASKPYIINSPKIPNNILLDISTIEIDYYNLKYLEHFKNIEQLTIRTNRAKFIDLKVIRDFSHLKSLKLFASAKDRNYRKTSFDFDTVNNLHTLEEINFISTKLTPKFLEQIKVLDLVSIDDFKENLTHLKNLQQLTLKTSELQTLVYLTYLKKLKFLRYENYDGSTRLYYNFSSNPLSGWFKRFNIRKNIRHTVRTQKVRSKLNKFKNKIKPKK